MTQQAAYEKYRTPLFQYTKDQIAQFQLLFDPQDIFYSAFIRLVMDADSASFESLSESEIILYLSRLITETLLYKVEVYSLENDRKDPILHGLKAEIILLKQLPNVFHQQ